jgi:rhodanese-related sulfurtransferase
MKLHALLLATALLMSTAVPAAEVSPVAKAIEEYLDFTEYGSSLIWPEQIPEDEWKKIRVIDARDAGQFAKDHIPGARNIDWRQIPGRRNEIPKDGLVVIYCNSGSLSAQAVFALRLLGWDNVKVLQDGLEGWKKKGGYKANALANALASKPAGH